MGTAIMVHLERYRNNEIRVNLFVFMELLAARISGRSSRKEVFPVWKNYGNPICPKRGEARLANGFLGKWKEAF